LKKISHKIVAGVTNPATISKAVLRSQPPHSADVPEMVQWSLKWSGGTTSFYTKELTHFCALKGITPDLHIPGRIFGALSKLDFAISMPARGIVAVLKRVSVSKRVVDSIASDIKVGDIMSLQRSPLKEIFLRANGVMERCFKTLATKGIHDPAATLHQGTLECDLIDFLFSKPDPKTAETAIEEMVSDWLKGLFGDDSAATPATSASSTTQSGSLVQYNDAGEAIDVGKLVLESEGVKVGNTYVRKLADSDDRVSISKLGEIQSDGTCVLHTLDNFGAKIVESNIEVKGADFLSKWKAYDKPFKFMPDHQGTSIKHCTMLQDAMATARIKASLFTLALDMKDYNIVHRISPTKAVFAKEDYPTDTMLFAPYGTVHTSDFAAKKKLFSDERNSIKVTLPGGEVETFIVHNSPPDDKTQITYFAIASTHTESLANMKVVHRDVRFLMPNTHKLKIAGAEHVARVPCLANIRDIAINEELMVFIPKPEKVAAQPSVRALKLPAAKKLKKA
jgi:hypothetical protein